MLCAVLGPVQKMNNSYLCNIIQWLIMLEILDNKFAKSIPTTVTVVYYVKKTLLRLACKNSSDPI